MTKKEFSELVELRTKIASVFPFVIAFLYSFVLFKQVNVLNMLLFFIGMICFDMATTVMNNLMDYVKAKNSDYRDNHNVIGTSSLTVKKAWQVFGILFAVAAVVGLVLVARTNILLLIVGSICFFIGVFYTFGPIPISRMPLGEVLSGFTMGFGIFWITVFLNVPEGTVFAGVQLDGSILTMQLDIIAQLKVFLLSLPLVCTIANIMLSNNICDLETDITNHRYTLVYYIGKKQALVVYQVLYAIAFGAILLAVLLGVAPWILLGALVAGVPVYKHIQQFKAVQEKKTTFALAIKNMVMIHVLQVVLLFVAVIFFN